MDKERKAIIKNSDMTEDMQQDAINVATKAIDSYNIEKDIACYIKKEFDRLTFTARTKSSNLKKLSKAKDLYSAPRSPKKKIWITSKKKKAINCFEM